MAEATQTDLGAEPIAQVRTLAIKATAKIVTVMAAVEVAVHSIVSELYPRVDHTLVSLLDSLTLAVTLDPLIYVFVYRPLSRHAAWREWAERERDAFLALSADLLCVVGFDGEIKRVNPAVETVLGWTSSDLLFKAFIDFVHPEDREAVIAATQMAAHGQHLPSHPPRRIRGKDGSYRWFVWESLIDRPRRLIFGLGRDVTEPRQAYLELRTRRDELEAEVAKRTAELVDKNERLNAEFIKSQAAMEALQESERRYRELADALPEPVFESNADGLVTFANQSALAAFGYTEEDLRAGQSIFQMLKTSELRWERADTLRCVGRERHNGEYEFERKDGSTFPGIISCEPIGRSGAAVGLRGIIVDISERKRAEAELRRLRLEWEAVFQSIGDPAVILDENQRVLAANKSTCEALRQPEERLKGKRCYEVFHRKKKPPRGCPMSALLDSGKQDPVEIVVEELGATCLVRCAPISNGDGKAQKFIHVATDVSALKRGEEQLRQSMERLNAALESTVRAMAMTVETRDPYTAGHQRRVAALASAIAQEMGLPEERVNLVRLAALIHDVGKIGVPAEILAKPGRLNEAEFRLVKDHPQVGFDILNTIEFPWPIAEVVRQHHERMDGSGYPAGWHGSDTLLEARVIAVADVVEAMASHRPYRPARGLDEALTEISRHADELYDRDVVEACVKVLNSRRSEFEEETIPLEPWRKNQFASLAASR